MVGRLNGHSSGRAVKLVLALVCLIAQEGEAIWLTIPNSGAKCMSEELQFDVAVWAKFIIGPAQASNSTISARVTSPRDDVLQLFVDVVQGHYTFFTDKAGKFEICFWADGQHLGGDGIMIELDWKTGSAAEFGTVAEHWELVRQHVTIQGQVEFELRKLERIVAEIHSNLMKLKNREAQISEISEITNARVVWFSMVSLGVCIIVSVFQMCYLKLYFKKKKII